MRKWLIGGVTLVILITAGVFALERWGGLRLPFVSDSCRVFTSSDTLRLEPEQLENAATITAVSTKMQLPPYAATVALATAFQESKLRNIAHGDRDSVGLFQQRPSQGWGSVDELLEPRIAAERFYDALANVADWEELSVTEAAQRVQLSAGPDAYAKWESDARNLASGLLGHEGAGVTCILRENGENGGSSGAERLESELRADIGELAVTLEGATLSAGTGSDPGPYGWQIAGWMVAKARTFGVETVRYAGRRWSAESGEWRQDSRASTTAASAWLE